MSAEEGAAGTADDDALKVAGGDEAPKVAGGDEAQKADVEKTAENIEAMARRMSKRQSMSKRRQSAGPSSDERVEVDRTALEAILDVSQRLQDIQKKSRVSMSTLALAHESYKDKQVNKVPH